MQQVSQPRERKTRSARTRPRLLAFPVSLADLGWKLAYLAVLSFGLPIRLLPYSGIRRLGRFFGGLSYYLPLGRRAIGRKHLDLAFGDTKSSHEKETILKNSLRNAGEVALSSFWSARVTRKNAARYMRFVGRKYLHERVEAGEPYLALMLHMGNWELAAVCSGFVGLPTNFVVHRLSNPYIDAYMADHRTRSGQGSIYHDEAARQILRTLKNKAPVTMVFDQNMRSGRGGIFVDFFGIPAATTRAAAAVALALDVRVYTVFTIPNFSNPSRYHDILTGPEIELQRTGDKQKDIEENTRRFNAEVEKIIRTYPDHWLWTHRRFKSRPEGEPGFY